VERQCKKKWTKKVKKGSSRRKWNKGLLVYFTCSCTEIKLISFRSSGPLFPGGRNDSHIPSVRNVLWRPTDNLLSAWLKFVFTP